MTTWKFWRGTIERAVKTFIQAIAGVLTAGEGLDLFTVDWKVTLTTALTTTVYSVLSSIISAPIGEPESASILSEPQ